MRRPIPPSRSNGSSGGEGTATRPDAPSAEGCVRAESSPNEGTDRMHALAGLPTADTLISANLVDYVIIALHFAFVLGIGIMARRSVSDSTDFFLSGRSLPAWVTGLAFI